MAISGFHVTVVIGGLLLLLHFLGLTRERSYDLLLLFLPFYALLTGASPPVLRAVTMGFLYLLAKRFHQSYSAIKAISLSFIGMTLLDPRQVLGLGFQLSFFVTFFLLLFTRPLSDRIRRLIPRIPEWLSISTAVLILAQAISFPLLLKATHQWSFLVLPANLLLVPIFAFLIPWGYLSLLLSLLSPEAGKLLSLPLEGVMSIIHDGISGFGNLPSFFFSISDPPTWGWILYLLFLLFFFSFLLKEEQREGTASLFVYRDLLLSFLFLLLFFFLPPFLSLFHQEVRITFFDVGQGDAILIQAPNGGNLLIDGGGVSFKPEEEWRRRKHPFEVGADLLVPALRAMGVNRLDWVVATHGDADHIGGLKEVISSIPVKHLLGNGLSPTTELERDLWREGEVRSIPAFRAIPGEFLHWGKQVTLSIHGPASSGSENKAGENNASVLLFLQAYGRKILFTGDLEAEGEKEWIDRVGPLDLDLLKVGHHGSKSSTSEEFLDATRPEAAIISVGKMNRYGHPSPEVLKRLEERGIKILRTDQLGAIQVRISPDGAVRLTSYPWK
ncbi:membrane hypothetical protein [[Clostridium] ultunense Esp]|nr:membrane hypothetical protein [[Clostridium] ultunense Esp]